MIEREKEVRSTSIEPPDIGERVFLIYGECVCGWWTAMHEGAHWPCCPLCGRQVKPLRNEPAPGDRFQGLGVTGTLMPELEARDVAEMPFEYGERRHFTLFELRDAFAHSTALGHTAEVEAGRLEDVGVDSYRTKARKIVEMNTRDDGRSSRIRCPHDGCPGLELYDGEVDGCGHPSITSGCPWVNDG